MTTTGCLVLVRHGETVGNSRIRYYGRTDLALSDAGRAQMRAAAHALATQFGITVFDRIFSSPLRRAREGARIIAGPAAVIAEIEDFREVDFGDFEGLTAGEIEARFPTEFARWNRDRLAPDYAYPRGESRAAFTARVERGVARILEQLGPEPTLVRAALVVVHRGVIRAITCRLTDAEPVIELGSIQTLARDGAGRWRVEQLDFTAHLTPAA
jgi:broad specificity phosphatase PhoE